MLACINATIVAHDPLLLTDKYASINMFYEGDLQSALAEAVQMAKLVACLVRGDSLTSTQHSSPKLIATRRRLRKCSMGK